MLFIDTDSSRVKLLEFMRMVTLIPLTLSRFLFKSEMDMWFLRMRAWRVILYRIVSYMQKDMLSYKGRKVPVVKVQYSFTSDKYVKSFPGVNDS